VRHVAANKTLAEVIGLRGLVRVAITASMALVAVTCGGGGGDHVGGDGRPTLKLTAIEISFDEEEITLTADTETTIEFDNQDQGLPHNFAIYEDESAATVIFQGDIVEGPDTVLYAFTAPDAGTYFFRCDVHPTQMTGTVVVE
jgi:plastocyanin